MTFRSKLLGSSTASGAALLMRNLQLEVPHGDLPEDPSECCRFLHAHVRHMERTIQLLAENIGTNAITMHAVLAAIKGGQATSTVAELEVSCNALLEEILPSLPGMTGMKPIADLPAGLRAGHG